MPCRPSPIRHSRPSGDWIYELYHGALAKAASESHLGYHHPDVLAAWAKHGVRLIEAGSPDELGGLLYVQDHREIPMCLMWCRKG